MLSLFTSVFSTSTTETINVGAFFVSILFALVLGIGIAFAHSQTARSSKSFLATLALLPAIVAVVIMMVNGNIGAGVAVAGTFSLVRFRSAPGTAREICSIFLAMGCGLICGMGYVGYAVVFTLIVAGMMVLLEKSGIGVKGDRFRTLRITVPESLDYDGQFDDLFETYTDTHELSSVKTTNMGSLFKLTYNIAMRDPSQEKAFIDELRCRNGNLEISISMPEVATAYEL